jgi:hypothetical protein
MARHLSGDVGEFRADNLIAGLTPPVKTASGIVAGLAAAERYARGTVLARSKASGKLYILGAGTPTDLTADCVLADDTDVATSDTVAAVYVMGCFNEARLTVKSGYTLTIADRDVLRTRGVYLGDMLD